MMQRLSLWSIAAFLFAAQCMPSYGYGPKGHRIVADIAARYLTIEAKAGIAAILGETEFHPHSLARMATWPDDIRSDKTWNPDDGSSSDVWNNKLNNTKWHFATVPDPDADLSYLATPPEDLWDGCIVPMLMECQAVLSGKQDGDKLTHLKFLIHLVGDIHQPMHVGNGTDRGGNAVAVTWFGSKTNLHGVWDTKLIENENLSYTEYATFLSEAITATKQAAWSGVDYVGWAQESATHRIQLYKDLGLDQADAPEPSLSYDYAYANKELTELRLQQAGVRLAFLLNTIFSS